jgi:pimeloyl-ACP methyl ester carboxylesterase
MYIARYGSGPRRFFGVHGWSGDHRTYAALVPYLPPDVTLYAPDLPGCGLSPDPAVWDLDALAGEVAEAIRRITPSTVVGNCTGGLLALRAVLALAETEVERFVLIDPFASWPWFIKVFLAPGGRSLYTATFGNPAGRWLVNAALAGKRNRGTSMTEGFRRGRLDATYRHLLALRQIRGPEDFSAVTVPMHIVYGARTFGGVRESMPRWKTIWPRAVFTEVPGAGHLPIADAPAALAGIIFSHAGEMASFQISDATGELSA